MDSTVEVSENLIAHDEDSFKFDDCKVIQLCYQKTAKPNTFYALEHALIYITRGEFVIQSPNISVAKGEAAFIRKATHLTYQKFPSPDGKHCEGILFFLTTDSLKDFLKNNRQIVRQNNVISSVLKINADFGLESYMNTVQSYLDNELVEESELVRLKILEILYLLIHKNSELTDYLFEFSAPPLLDLANVMEANFTKPASLNDFAYLSGRSLSKFKRDFSQTFHVSPSRWLKEKRLQYAYQLLTQTEMSVINVCYEVGFENVAHFSRAFKEFFGESPSAIKRAK
jgi:AraC family transcriptional regulator, exoenzyme S synthesis regulatory protein ExsA